MIIDKIKSRGEDMSILEGHDRLQYIIDEARKVEPLAQEHKTEENKIRGCISNLWVTGKVLEDGTMQYQHDADSHMTKGTAKVILDVVILLGFVLQSISVVNVIELDHADTLEVSTVQAERT